MLKGRDATIGMSRILPAIMRIADDKETMERVRKGGTDNAVSSFATIVESHADDLLTILSVVSGRDPEEYAENATMQEQIRDMAAFMLDDGLVGFLKGASAAARSGEAQPSHLESTEG